MSEVKRMSDGGRIDDVLEVGLISRKKIIVTDIGISPRPEYIQGVYRAGKAIQGFLLRLQASHRSPEYLVPMDNFEYRDYRDWKDSRESAPSS